VSSSDQVKSFANNLAAGAVWDGIKQLWGPVVLAGIVAVWEKVKHGSLDWFAIGGMFLVASLLAFLSFSKPKQSSEGKPQQWKPAWQKLQWANAERERLQGEVRRWKEMYESTANPEITEEMRQSVAYQNKLIELGRSIEGILNPLQIEAIQLSAELLTFLKRLGPPPTPKYSAKDIENMPTAQMDALVRAEDGDFAEACEYYQGDGQLFIQTANSYSNKITARWKRLLPWYQKLAASYALELKDKVETMRNRFIIEGFTDEVLLLPIEGKGGEKRVRAIAAKLWELAYRVGEKEKEQ
jgi:hypothetical protein